MPIKVIIRADASRQMGSGHVMRCAALAQVLRERQAEITFVCRAHQGHYCDWLEEQGGTVLRLPPPAAGTVQDRRLTHAAWLGVTQARDAEETSAALGDDEWDWLIVDHYGLDVEWEQAMRQRAKRIMAIDDLADRSHDADILLDQNLQSEPDRYLGLLPEGCTQMLGPAYALLRPEFARLRTSAAPRSGGLKRLLVFMGGSDPQNTTSRVLEGVRQAALAIRTDVVMGAAGGGLESVRQRCEALPDCGLHVQTDDMAQLMAAADLTIGAPGTATWERCCLGLPSLLVVLAENQRELGYQVARRRAAILLGEAGNVSVDDIAGMLKRLALRPALLRGLSRNAERLCDGGGAERVSSIILLPPVAKFEVRLASQDDETLLLNWANDPKVRKNAFATSKIEPSTHRTWLTERLRNVEGCRIYIVESPDGVPIGQVRFEKKQNGWEIDFSIDEQFRGRSLGKGMLHAAMLKFQCGQGSVDLVGKVKQENIASQRVFESLCYERKTMPQESRAGEIIYFRVLGTCAREDTHKRVGHGGSS